MGTLYYFKYPWQTAQMILFGGDDPSGNNLAIPRWRCTNPRYQRFVSKMVRVPVLGGTSRGGGRIREREFSTPAKAKITPGTTA